ncbi:hypothetical protein MAPG_05309 [Magnaporthiopsis poae ATCC 64411]|uniref:LysM domain-containing protein n=1 Tax=Magnaporthiopsis poae (strain ATCC 64411 / 73-15) TaxID=644358 RepID=A0A0C4DZ20_MAGP6|nr:hypothetical protein MAPG_05309 [Magnaporthiopsis poae ATCC 64411]
MHFSSSLSLFACALISGSGLVSGAPHGRRGVQCYFEIQAQSGDTCESVAASWGLSADAFTKINPGVSCPTLETGKAYCVIGEWTPDPQPTTTASSTTTTSGTSTRPTTTPTTTAPSPTNTPQMPGIVANCNRFYKVQSGDGCDVVAQKNGITVSQLRSWNTEINDSCSNLWLGYYICVGVQSGDGCDIVAQKNGITVSQLRSWNTEINDSCSNLWLGYYICVGVPGATNPNTPALPGAVSNCDKWHKIASGDTCDTIAAKNTITVAQFRSWNTQIDSNCNNLLRDYYACVGVPGAATPMPGIVPGCKRYYLVVSGDNCDAIASKNSITVANFRLWNTAINSECTNLWANALVCTSA